MDLATVAEALSLIVSPLPLLSVLGGVLLGVLIGALPGLSATMGIALFSPLSFFLPATLGIPFLLGLYKGGIYGGAITAILLGTPGTASSAATVLDGVPMRQRGMAGKALRVAIDSSFIGDMFSNIVLIALLGPASQLALKFGQPEMFALVLFALTMITFVTGSNLVKGLLAAMAGAFLALIGVDPITGSPRMTFGLTELSAGLDIIPLVIGLFALAEVLNEGTKGKTLTTGAKIDAADLDGPNSRLSWREFRPLIPTAIRSSFIGSFLAILPGIGSETSCWLGYATAKRLSRHPEEFGKGTPEGVAAPEAANNAVCGATLIPLLSFGIPGDICVAVLLGAFLAQGLRPGPNLLSEHTSTVYAFFISMMFASFFMLIIGNSTTRLWVRILRIPRHFLYPIIAVLSLVGSYAINNSLFDVAVAVIFGFVGYGMKRLHISPAPLLLAFVLTPMLEEYMKRTLVLHGSAAPFVTSPIALGFLLLSLAVVVGFVLNTIRKSRRPAESASS